MGFAPPHRYISGLRWAGAGGGGGGATQLFTGSYDGSLRALDLGAGGVSRLAYGDEESEFSAMDVMADARWVGWLLGLGPAPFARLKKIGLLLWVVGAVRWALCLSLRCWH